MKEKPVWYLEAVKPMENRHWTSRDRLKILNLREKKKLSIPVIAEYMHATSNQINNQLRTFRKAVELKCRKCGDPLDDENRSIVVIEQKSALCKKCKEEELEYKRGLRNEALQKGLCGYCQKRKKIPGTCACRQCLSATYRRRRRESQCVQCKKPSTHGVFCKPCAKLNRERVSQAVAA
jgi:hypothetical protein